MFRCFVKRARYYNHSPFLQRSAAAKHHWDYQLIRNTSCSIRGVGPQQELSWTAYIGLYLPVPSTIARQISSSCACLRKAHHGDHSKSNKSAIKRNKRIVTFGKEGNWKAMLSLHAQEKEDFNIVNYATLMTFIARIRSANIKHPLFLEFTDDVAQRVEEDGISKLSPRDISNMIYSFGKMNLRNRSSMKIMDRLSNEDVADVFTKRSNAQDLSNVVLAYANLEETDATVLFEAIDRHSDRMFKEGDPQAVSNTLWGFAKLGFKPNNLLFHVENHAEWLVENGNPQDVANSVWAFATLGMEAPKFFLHVEKHAKWIVENGNPQDFSNIAWSFATGKIQALELFSIIEKHAKCLVENGTPQAISNTAWAFASLDITAPNLFFYIEEEAEWLVANGNPQDLANTAWAFASLDITAPNLFFYIEKQAEWLVANGKPQEVANTAWAFASMGVTAPNLFFHIDKQAEWLVANGIPQDISNTAWAFASMGVTAPNLFFHIDKQAEWLVANGIPQDISNTAWAFASMGVTAPNLFFHIEEQAEWLVSNGDPQAISNTAWASAVVGYQNEELFKSLDLHLEKITVKSDLQAVTNISYAIALLDFSTKYERLLLHLWKTACQMDPTSFQKEDMRQLVQVKLFAEADGVKLPEFPLHLQKKMSEINVTESQSRSQNQVSSCLTALGFVHDVEVPPVDDCVIEGMLAIDMACKERKIAIEYDGLHHFMKDIKTGDVTRMENGPTKAKRRFLERNGWTVININYQDWMEMKEKSTQKKFLRKILIEAGVEF